MHEPKINKLVHTLSVGIMLVSTASLAQQPPPQPPSGSSLPPPQNVQNAAPTPTSAPAPETQALHITPGRSIIVNMQTRLRRVLVSNPAVIETVTTSPTQVVLTAKSAGSSSVILWDESGTPRIFDVFADVDVSGLRDALQQAYPGESIQVSSDQGRVVLTGSVPSQAVSEEANKIAAPYSKDVVNSLNVPTNRHNKQILLKVTFAEVNRTKLNQFGINFLSTGALNTPGAISTQQFGPPSLGGGGGTGGAALSGTIGAPVRGATSSFNVNDLLNVFLFRPDLNLAVTIKDLQSRNILQVLAEPNLMAINGQPAKFIAGGEFPYPVVQSNAGNSAITIQFKPFGVRLEFTGTIGSDNVIRLKVAPEVSALDFSNALTVSGFLIPALSTRRAETEIELKSGQSFGIAGLLDHRTTASLNKIPGIADIPILGLLFRSKALNNTSDELMVMVTPVIVDPVNEEIKQLKLPDRPIPMLDEKKYDKALGVKPEAGSQPQPATK